MKNSVFVILDKKGKVVSFNSINKSAYKVWNIKYDKKTMASPIQDNYLSETFNWFNIFMSAFCDLKKGIVGLHTAFNKLIIADSGVSSNTYNKTDKNEHINVFSVQSSLSLYYKCMKLYAELFNHFIDKGYKIKIL